MTHERRQVKARRMSVVGPFEIRCDSRHAFAMNEIKWGILAPIVVISLIIAIGLAKRPSILPKGAPTCVEVAKTALNRGRAAQAELDFLDKCGPD
jgi:hypothetical protein